jgi:Na+/H+ antiporter NhaD/arsenite permease-like protein
MNSQNRVLRFFKAETVLCIAAAAAIISMIFTPPSAEYLSYIDFRVLALLFCLMAVVAGFNKTGLFIRLSEKLLHRTGNTRSLCCILILLCFFTSMWITNDVALITFVPFAILLLTMADKTGYLIFVVVLQTIAANLGSMLTPVGNPQNLYLYSYYNIPVQDFLLITLPVTAASLLLLLLSVFLIKKEPLKSVLKEELPGNSVTASAGASISLPSGFTLMYGSLFLVSLLCVVRLIDYRLTLAIVLAAILIFDREIIKKVDYSLLLTFVCFFLFVGNIGSIPAAKNFLGVLLKGRELPVSVLVSQVISNVPAAVLLSAFTQNSKALILGTDLGGLGTLVASLASLISYKLYCRSEGAKPLRYLGVFTLYNILFLVLLSAFLMVLQKITI